MSQKANVVKTDQSDSEAEATFVSETYFEMKRLPAGDSRLCEIYNSPEIAAEFVEALSALVDNPSAFLRRERTGKSSYHGVFGSLPDYDKYNIVHRLVELTGKLKLDDDQLAEIKNQARRGIDKPEITGAILDQRSSKFAAVGFDLLRLELTAARRLESERTELSTKLPPIPRS